MCVTKFEKEQEVVLSILIDMGREDDFQKGDINITDVMETLCGEIGSMMASLQSKSYNMHAKTVSGPVQSVILQKYQKLMVRPYRTVIQKSKKLAKIIIFKKKFILSTRTCNILSTSMITIKFII